MLFTSLSTSNVVQCGLYFQIVSGILIGLMAWVIDEKDKKVETTYDFFLDPAIILCLVSCIAFLISGFGWVGAFRENLLCLTVVSD